MTSKTIKLEIELERCASGLYQGRQKVECLDAFGIAAQLSKKFPATAIVDFRRIGVEVPVIGHAEQGMSLLADFGPGAAPEHSPLILQAPNLGMLGKWIRSGWEHDGAVVLFSYVTVPMLHSYLQSFCEGLSADEARRKLCQLAHPSSVNTILSSDQSLGTAIVEPCECVLTTSPDAPGGWVLFGNDRLIVLLQRCSIRHQTKNSAQGRVSQKAPPEEAQPQPPAAQPQSPAAQPQSPAAQPQSPAAQPQSPAAQPQSPAAQPQSPAAQPQPPAAQPQSPAAQPHSQELPPHARALLRITSGPGTGRWLLRPGIHWVVGRAEPSDIVIADDRRLSREHFLLAFEEDGRCTIKDLSSSNGTFINGERVETRDLLGGDEIYAGESRFAFEPDNRDDMPGDPNEPLPDGDTDSVSPISSENTFESSAAYDFVPDSPKTDSTDSVLGMTPRLTGSGESTPNTPPAARPIEDPD